MIISKKFEYMPIRGTQLGSLIVFTLDGSPALAIKFAASNIQGENFVIVIKSNQEIPHPFWRNVEPDTFVATYGADWVLDIGSAEDAIFDGSDSVRDIGNIIIEGESAKIRVAHENQRTSLDCATVRLDNFRFGDPPGGGKSFYVKQWKIWLSEADKNKPGAIPYFMFPS